MQSGWNKGWHEICQRVPDNKERGPRTHVASTLVPLLKDYHEIVNQTTRSAAAQALDGILTCADKTRRYHLRVKEMHAARLASLASAGHVDKALDSPADR